MADLDLATAASEPAPTPSELPAVVTSVVPSQAVPRVALDAAAPVSTPSPTRADGAGGRRMGAAAKVANALGRIDFSHPLTKLAMLGLVLVAIGGIAVESRDEPSLAAAPTAPPAPTPPSASPPSIASVAVTAPAPAASRGEGDSELVDVDPLDTDPGDAPPPRRRSNDGTSESHRHGSNHAPDAKPGVNTGYRDGEPVKVTLTMIDGKPVEEHTAAAFRKMQSAAQRSGISIVVVSGFRTMDRQRELYADYRAGRGHLAALPGHSNHQSGQALDLAVSAPKVRAWLESRAKDFGFQRTVPSEAWHWEHTGG